MDKTRIAENLKEARNRRGLTQEQVADSLAVSIGTISGYERGYRKPDPEMIRRLADLYSVSADWLLGRPSPITDKETYTAEVRFPGLVKEDSPSLELYISEIRDVVSRAVEAGDIPAEDAEEIVKANIRYLKFQIEEKKKKS